MSVGPQRTTSLTPPPPPDSGMAAGRRDFRSVRGIFCHSDSSPAHLSSHSFLITSSFPHTLCPDALLSVRILVEVTTILHLGRATRRRHRIQ